jgi:hypothetical protein
LFFSSKKLEIISYFLEKFSLPEHLDERCIGGYLRNLLFETLRFLLNFELETKIFISSRNSVGESTEAEFALSILKDCVQLVSLKSTQGERGATFPEKTLKMILLFDFGNFGETFSDFIDNCATISEECGTPITMSIDSLHLRSELTCQRNRPFGFSSISMPSFIVSCRSFLLESPDVCFLGDSLDEISPNLFFFNFDQQLSLTKFDKFSSHMLQTLNER